MDVIVRPARVEDSEGIVNVLNPIIAAGSYTVLDTLFTADEEREFISGFPKRGIFHVAVNGENTIAGFQNVEPFATYTRAFEHVGVIGTYVDLAHRRQGIASRLFAATFDVAARMGYEKMLAFVRADNPAALATYKRHGFVVIGTARRQAKVQGRYIDEIFMERIELTARSEEALSSSSLL